MGNVDLKPGRRLAGGTMRAAGLALTLAVILPAGAQTVSENYDRISGERTIAYTADGSTDLRRPVLTFNSIIASGMPTAAINLAFVSTGETAGASAMRFAACHAVDWFVDGQPLQVGQASHRGSIVDGELIELIDQHVSASWVAAIGAAQTVRYRVCRDEYTLTAADIQAFGRVSAKLKSGMSSYPAPRAATPAAPAAEVQYQGMNWRPRH